MLLVVLIAHIVLAAPDLTVAKLLRPGMVLAILSTQCVLLLALTSGPRPRFGIPYEVWHGLHLVGYVSRLLAAVWHQVDADSALADPAVRTLWLLPPLALAASAVALRVVRPVRMSLRHYARLHSVEPPLTLTNGRVEHTVFISGRDLDQVFSAGQWGHFYCRDGRFRILGNPYSPSGAPTAGMLRLTIVDQPGSRHWEDLSEGARVWFDGPYGDMTVADRAMKQVTFIVNGTGATPVLSLLHTMLPELCCVTVIQQGWEQMHEDGPVRAELAMLQRKHGLVIHQLPRRNPPLDHRTLGDWAPMIAKSEVYVWGPPTWVRDVERAARRAGVPRVHLHSERLR